MISLISGFWKTCTSKPNYKILIIGTDNSGKTTLLNQLKAINGQKHHAFDRITPTVGLNKGFTILLWDLGGKDILRPIWKKYYPECYGIIYMIDGANEDKLADSLNTLKEVVENRDIEGVPIVIFVNKKDKENFYGKEKVLQNFDLKSVKNRDINIFEVSVVNKTNLDESLQWLYESIRDFYASANR